MSTLKFLMSMMLIYISLFVSWSVNTWISLWILMEVSFLIFVSLVMLNSNYSISELMLKYYIFQVVSGMWLMVFFMMGSFTVYLFVDLGVWTVLALKLGLAPFHGWLISLVGKMSWYSFMIMSSVLKLPPMAFVFYLMELSWAWPFLMLTGLVGSTMGLNNQSIQKVLSYSSMVGVGWMILAASEGVYFFFFFFFCYFISLFSFCYFVSLSNVYYINQFKSVSSSSFGLIIFFWGALSFSGVPPFLGFLMKWSLSWSLVFLGFGFFICFLVLISLFSLLYYFQLYFYFMLIGGFNFKWYSFSFSFIVWSFMFYFVLSGLLMFFFIV